MVANALEIYSEAPAAAFVDAFVGAVLDPKKLSFKRSERSRMMGRVVDDEELESVREHVDMPLEVAALDWGGKVFGLLNLQASPPDTAMRLLFYESNGNLHRYHHSLYSPWARGTALAIKERLEAMGYPARIRSNIKVF